MDLLHSRGISSFLVTNAQFPDEIRALHPVCQLYVSVDASTKDSLKKIDRPLFPDFWPRFVRSLEALSEKGQRTVYRLTLVKGWNAAEVQQYADLVAIGRPEFIEVKVREGGRGGGAKNENARESRLARGRCGKGLKVSPAQSVNRKQSCWHH